MRQIDYSNSRPSAVKVSLLTIFFSFPPFLQVRQIDYSNSRSSAVKVSLLTIGQQAVMDSYLCLMHLTTGIYTYFYIYVHIPHDQDIYVICTKPPVYV